MKKRGLQVLIVVLIFFGGMLCSCNRRTPLPIRPFSKNLSCKQMHDELDDDFEDANYCKDDSDCSVLTHEDDLDFGCYHFVHQKVDHDQLHSKMGVYKQKCRQFIDNCAPAPDARCIANSCVPARPEATQELNPE